MRTLIMGVDPGLTGAIAILDVSAFELEVWDTPTFTVKAGKKNRTEIDFDGFGKIVAGRNVTHTFIEKVNAMPKQGVASSFNFGQTFGAARMLPVICQSAVTMVTPQQWKKALKAGQAGDKDAAIKRATQLMPNCSELWHLKKHDGRAEAALIAYYGALHELGFTLDQTITPATLKLAA